MNAADRDGEKRGRRPRSRAEWCTFGASVVVLAGVVAGLVAQLAQGDEPPRPVVETRAAERQPDGTFHVPVDVRNDGDRAAAEVQVNAELTRPEGTTSADQVIDFLAPGESETLVFVFDVDPATGELDVAVGGFGLP